MMATTSQRPASKRNEIDVLIDEGRDDWELVSIIPNAFAYLKRPSRNPTKAKRPSPGPMPLKLRRA
jgi:hypothetical protein